MLVCMLLTWCIHPGFGVLASAVSGELFVQIVILRSVFPEKVCNESGLSAYVCEGGPYLCGLVCFLVEGRGGMSWGGGFVRVVRKSIVQHDIMDSLKFFLFIISQVVCVQPIV